MTNIRSAALTAVAVFGFASLAAAADLPAKAPVVPPATPPQVSGYLELYTGGGSTHDLSNDPLFPIDDRYTNWALGGAGRANWWAMPNASLQLDLQADGNQYRSPTSVTGPGRTTNFSTLSYLTAAHVNIRDPQMGLLGAFGGIGDVSGNSLTIGTDNSGVRYFVSGLEAQYYWGMLTLYAQGGYDSTLDISNTTLVNRITDWFGRGTARYFLTPNMMIEGTGQYASGAIQFESLFGAPNTTLNTWLWRAKVEWRPGTLPFSLFGIYEGSRTDYAANPFYMNAPERMSDNRFMAGIRLYLGQDTLLANDRRGATLDVVDPLGGPTSPLMVFPRGLFFPISDSRLKRDITQVGRLDNGLGLYSYRYLWSDTVYVGVMAQEVALIRPDAVVHGVDGYLRVNYDRLGMHLMTLRGWNARSEGGQL